MQQRTTLALAAAALALLAQLPAHAASVTSDAGFVGAKVITFNGYDGLIGTGPEDVGAEVGESVLFTSAPFTELGANARELGENGLWGARGNPVDGLVDTPTGNGNFVASGFIGNSGELGFRFGSGMAGVGAYLNQFQIDGVSNSFTLLAYGQSGNVLETTTVSIDTDAYGYNEGSFLGFQRASADIYGFGIAGNGIVLDNLTFTTAVPEPESYALLLAGLGVVGLLVRRRRAD
ncbi:PEP-CTERM sorting domain-containing protein [Paucibacter sp. XJ19-41]|uniref:PEP-CTERM sorting domain-containing protein n=1 Tax=Paucibacter sp. XJ19-41 TaxID=2927824 RepID=UPI00234A3A38|nr:PEP-CTERM sorting domain-containing protein [Paucibacter sp. XJ19-41]MDC6167651.1 PEP-CTERM sorting domain-containing protein [Paucibacter sp. XJ19-41]